MMALTCPGHISLDRKVSLLLTILSLILLTLPGCTPTAPAPAEESEMTLSLSSPAFAKGDQIPVNHTCDGQDMSPPLAWSEPPQQTKTFALVVDDPDAPLGVFTHWVLFNLPADIRQLPEGITAQPQLENGALQGKNDFGKTGYDGPCPPPGSTHQYRFTLYALDAPLNLKAEVSKKQLLDTMKGQILAQGQLTGTYRR